MRPSWKPIRGWVLAWGLITLAGAAALARLELMELRDAFDTNARIMHRLLSQRVVQHDAILATLALLQPGPDGPADLAPEQRLPALYAQILAVQRRDREAAWADPVLAAAEIASRTQKRAVLGTVDFAAGRYQLLLASQPSSYALTIDLRAMVPWAEWPLPPATSPVRVTLEHAGQSFVLQPGQPASGGWTLRVSQAPGRRQPALRCGRDADGRLDRVALGRMALWALFVAAVLALRAMACASARPAAAPRSCCAWDRWRG